jgi:hypothetical protein
MSNTVSDVFMSAIEKLQSEQKFSKQELYEIYQATMALLASYGYKQASDVQELFLDAMNEMSKS